METKKWLYGMTLSELTAVATECDMPAFAGRQIADWLYKKNVGSIAEMTNLSLKARENLSVDYCVGVVPYMECRESSDGTKKYLFPTLQHKYIETAYIPDGDRATLCVSSQAGCRMGCRFCMTARQGFQHHLTSGEILNQIKTLPEFDNLTNVVYMGMGEPLDNLQEVLKSLEILTSTWGYGWSPTRITVSTIGVLPALQEFLSRSKVHLAVSLHHAFAVDRKQLMPAENAHPIQAIIEEIRRHDFSHQRRVSFEYILFRGLNDTPEHARALAKLLKGLRCRVNLIRYHTLPDSSLIGSDEETVLAFRDTMNALGVLTTVRASRGQDIEAACGMLSTKHKN